jgi:acyl carrier protein
LWFEALAGICAHVRGGGGGLTPSDIPPARLSQQQIDELQRQYRIADILPLTPLQQGLLFHASAAQGSGDDVYAVQLDITITGPLEQHRLRDAVHTVVNRYPNLAAQFCVQFDEPVQIIPADPVPPWRHVELDASGVDVDEQIQRLCAAERAAVSDLANPPAFRAALIRTAPDRHRFVLTNHHVLMDGWSLQILLREIFASYYRHRLSAAVSYRRFVDWLAGRDRGAAQAAWREVLAGFDTPTLVGPPDRLGLGERGAESFRVPAETTHAISELARSQRTTVSTVLQGAWALLLMWLTGHHDVVFGAVVSGRPTEVAGAESMVGLLINTVPVRATITAATTTADLLDQLQSAHNHTLEHQHLALSDIHRITGQERLFDTVFVYENYPIETAALSGVDGLAITEITNRDYYHYPLTIQAVPGRELDLRVQFRTELFDVASIEALIERLRRVFVAMAADPTRRLSSVDVLDAGEHARPGGYRIEPGQVQAALAGVDGVEQAVVIAREDRPGDRRLVGYVTGTSDLAAVRAKLADRLPPYMVPAAIVELSALPLTVNGKLDKRALPAPECSDAEGYRPPANAVEEIVAGIYAQVLGIERVGVDDSFFDMGGDSLSAMRVIAAINTALDVRLAVPTLFHAASVRSLSQQLSRHASTDNFASVHGRATTRVHAGPADRAPQRTRTTNFNTNKPTRNQSGHHITRTKDPG